MSSTTESETKNDHAADRVMDHSYDGIQEYDNPMPRWWVWIFWGSFWFSLAYLFHFWLGNGVSVADAYADDVRVASEILAKEALKVEVSEESLARLSEDATSVEAGGAVFAARCVTCHLEKGEGSIGPNLTDDYWIHGRGTLLDIYGTVSEGVAAKGMPAWNRQLSPTELRQVVAYVGTLRGTHVEGKAPQGEPVASAAEPGVAGEVGAEPAARPNAGAEDAATTQPDGELAGAAAPATVPAGEAAAVSPSEETPSPSVSAKPAGSVPAAPAAE